ncbi:CoB--CoM heterodisulfide reductase iron-sulfur subunit A family protein [Ectothiorhodospiraceae bacterium BW-2]|nr:CoB--CoM heterodisulfide reductase iron-sulfur subunit A family protein [Ectothiorhodospiraceae bacterium BW-2]
MSEVIATNETILVVGGGISGLTAALEAAECGKQVLLLEKAPSVGGRVSQLYKYFPKLCYPQCGLEIQYRRLKANKNIRLMTMAEVTGISGESGNYSVDVKVSPRYVNENCTACGACGEAVEAEFDDEFNYQMKKRKGAYIPSPMAYPQRYILDPALIGTDDATKAKEACRFEAIDLEMAEQALTLSVGAVIWATGWKPYDAAKIQPYGYDRYENVITNVEFERMLDPFGPTAGKIQRPSDGAAPKNIAFIQCAGSRDKNHLKHCSRICCMATLKQTTYVAEKLGDECQSTVYYIDIRAIDRIDDFHQKVKADPNVSFVKSKVANIVAGANGNVILHGVDTEGYNRYASEHDLVVLATGMESTVPAGIFPEGTVVNEHNFIDLDESNGAIFGAGCSSDALDVNRAAQNATAAALRAIQIVNQVSAAEA